MNIWFDLSDLYDWRGHFTGIQRVVFNLAKLFYENDDKTRFFILQSGKVTEVDFSVLEQRLITEQEQSKIKALHDGEANKRLTLTDLKIKVAQSSIGPALLKVNRRLKQSYKDMLSLQSIRHDRVYGGEAEFSPDDVVLITGGNWLVKDYADKLVELHKQKKFTLVHAVNDIIAVRNPALVSPGGQKIIGEYFETILNEADYITTISDATKRDVEWLIEDRTLNHPSGIKTIHLGSDLSSPGLNPVAPQQDIPSNFILCVGTIEVRKNHRLLYYAYKMAHEQNIELPTLVIVGKKGWMIDETYWLIANDSEIKDRIVVLEDTTDAELEWLYANCLHTVFPSMHEGWGLPIAESLAHGKTCIASNHSSMPEVAPKDLVTFVSPFDTRGLMEAIVRNSDEASLKRIEMLISKKYKVRTWQDTYLDYKALITSIIGK